MPTPPAIPIVTTSHGTGLTNTWVDHIPFICPRQLVEPDHSAHEGLWSERLVRRDKNTLASSNATYRVENGVPFLRPEDECTKVNGTGNREEFYAKHYETRSRVTDLESGYLTEAKRFVAEFVSHHRINELVLEVGCGTGILAECAPQYLGMDFSSTSVFAEGFEGFRRFVGDAQCIPLATSSVELVISYNTLEHVPNPDLAFREIHRVLKPGGHVILHPAWNCSILQTRLIPVRSYGQLRFPDKILKAMQPMIKSRIFKACTRIPYRVARKVLSRNRKSISLRYRKLDPYLGTDVFIADCDATASIDIFDAILFFTSRGYQCSSHPTLRQQLLAGHAVVVAEKPVE